MTRLRTAHFPARKGHSRFIFYVGEPGYAEIGTLVSAKSLASARRKVKKMRKHPELGMSPNDPTYVYEVTLAERV